MMVRRRRANPPPAVISDLDRALVVSVLARHSFNVSDAAQDLGVSGSDLRRLTLSSPELQDQVYEVVEARLDKAEKNIAASLDSDDGRERLAASMFTLRNSHRARKRGWITNSTSAAELSISTEADQPRETIFSWRNPDGSNDERATETFERDGKTFTVPKYGYGGGDRSRDDDCVEGELSTEPALIEPPPPEPPSVESNPEPPQLPKWPGPYAPPPLVAHLYAAWTPPRPAPESEPPPQPALLRRLTRGG
jgi:hypothetical protein